MEKTVTIVGIRFRRRGKVYYFSPGKYTLAAGSHAIVETARGMEYGTVVIGNRDIPEKEIVPPLKEIIRPAKPEDDKTYEDNLAKEKTAVGICQERCNKHELEMKVLDCEYTFDRTKVLFYFTADGRVDFRELVKDLASVFRARIELRQVGVRDVTRLLGGIGICGRELCCASYLKDFIPVSVKMAKEQSLSLNPAKISGNCGRLMCCLKYEEDAYEYLNSKFPDVGATVITDEGEKGEVISTQVLRQRVKVLVQPKGTNDEDSKEVREYDVNQLTFKPTKRRYKSEDDREARALEEMERKEGRYNNHD